MVQSAVEDDGFPDNLAPPKQNMVKRGETTSSLGLAQKFDMLHKKTNFQAKSESILQKGVQKGGFI